MIEYDDGCKKFKSLNYYKAALLQQSLSFPGQVGFVK